VDGSRYGAQLGAHSHMRIDLSDWSVVRRVPIMRRCLLNAVLDP
jgi:hypothetical protein